MYPKKLTARPTLTTLVYILQKRHSSTTQRETSALQELLLTLLLPACLPKQTPARTSHMPGDVGYSRGKILAVTVWE